MGREGRAFADGAQHLGVLLDAMLGVGVAADGESKKDLGSVMKMAIMSDGELIPVRRSKRNAEVADVDSREKAERRVTIKNLEEPQEKLIVLLRDGRKLLGTLCSFDQFANVVLQGACERVIVGEQYCDVPLGLYVIRGENVVLIGELDREKDELPAHMTCVSEAEIRKAEKAEREARDLKGTMRKRMEFLDFD
ncbi:unnamed protein product [Miscanthus lutarioriparius]|uniref:U6 snRNA-associated Sm-like protein LSm1 n=1 Tax=Miscanthus lutarioriparius TaxID=422564 RepID=A0A811QQL2_9POAL|nr:unnamed protein product [Miscanthus lutarioriparius]